MCKCSNKIGNFITLRHFPAKLRTYSPTKNATPFRVSRFAVFAKASSSDYSSASVASSGSLNSVKPAATSRLNHATAFLMSEA